LAKEPSIFDIESMTNDIEEKTPRTPKGNHLLMFDKKKITLGRGENKEVVQLNTDGWKLILKGIYGKSYNPDIPASPSEVRNKLVNFFWNVNNLKEARAKTKKPKT